MSATAGDIALPPLRQFIAGAWREPRSGAGLATEDPSTGRRLCELPAGTAGDVDDAVRAARDALDAWRATAPVRRRDLLVELARLVRANAREITALEALDTGMPVLVGKRLSAGALRRNLEYHAGWAERLTGEVIPVSEGTLDYTIREPLGVVGAIIPWNTPALFCGSKAGAALACGNTVVLKPSPWGSLTVLRFAELAAEAGLPDGVLNVVCGGADAGVALVEHAGVDALSFTGSTSTGRDVMARAAARVKHVHLELGGKSPQIVFEDADLDRAAFSVAANCFGLSGQACAAGTRLLVQEAVADELTAKVVAASATFSPGDPLEPSTVMGPLVSRAQLDRVLGYVEAGRREATLATGGTRVGSPPLDARLAGGFFVAPTVFTGCANDAAVCRDEIFGPVLSVLTFRDEQEAVAIANDTHYGLAAGVWTDHVSRAHRVAARLQAGTIWINSYGALPNAAPFGGVKQSGTGRDGGRESALAFTQVKNVYLDLG